MHPNPGDQARVSGRRNQPFGPTTPSNDLSLPLDVPPRPPTLGNEAAIAQEARLPSATTPCGGRKPRAKEPLDPNPRNKSDIRSLRHNNRLDQASRHHHRAPAFRSRTDGD